MSHDSWQAYASYYMITVSNMFKVNISGMWELAKCDRVIAFWSLKFWRVSIFLDNPGLFDVSICILLNLSLIYICMLAQSLGRLHVPSTKPSSLSELQKSSFVSISHFWFFSDSVSRPNFYFGSLLKSWPYLPHFTYISTRSCDSKSYMAHMEWKSLAI